MELDSDPPDAVELLRETMLAKVNALVRREQRKADRRR